MEHSSYELSVQLRDAGFPQPDIDNGQVWWRIRFPGGHMRYPAAFQYVKTRSGRLDDIPLDGMEWCGGPQVYAPTPLDILKELPSGYGLFRIETGFQGDMWACYDPSKGSFNIAELFTSPGDAAADAWKCVKIQKL